MRIFSLSCFFLITQEILLMGLLCVSSILLGTVRQLVSWALVLPRTDSVTLVSLCGPMGIPRVFRIITFYFRLLGPDYLGLF